MFAKGMYQQICDFWSDSAIGQKRLDDGLLSVSSKAGI